ncbi:MAG TPA: outer membrane beta-barrel protein [Burkholderiales bacterium]|nr:outer membrane beta-barrel protein [Burkholderiales bacterium]
MENLHQRTVVGKFSALRVVLTLALGIFFTPMAQAAGGFAGGGFGQTKVDIECDLDITCSSDDSDSGFKIFGGYQFNPNFAFEVGYYDLGEAKLSGTDSFLGSTTATIEASGFNFALVGSIPLGERFELMAKAGIFRWDLDVSATSSVFGSGSDSETGFDPMFGIGAAFNFSKNLGLRVEYEKFLDVGDEDTTGESDVDFLSASIVFRF